VRLKASTIREYPKPLLREGKGEKLRICTFKKKRKEKKKRKHLKSARREYLHVHMPFITTIHTKKYVLGYSRDWESHPSRRGLPFLVEARRIVIRPVGLGDLSFDLNAGGLLFNFPGRLFQGTLT
jgi:hypothetical protein